MAGRYRLLERLHRRGNAEVHLAWDDLTGTEVALKLLPEDADAPQLRAEVAALRLLHLPGVARLLDEGLHERRPFLALELVTGEPFPGIPPGPPPSWPDLRDRVVSLLEVLARVHDRGVLHRDLKPDNVLVTETGRPVVLDFGLSSGVAIGSGRDPDRRAVGTPAYAAPEQLLGRPLDARADLYALGVMLYESLAGRGPQDAQLPDELIHQRLHQDPEPLASLAPELPPAVGRLVDDMLARDPARRPRSAADCLRRLAGGRARGPDRALPWLGGEQRVDRLRAAVASGRPVLLVAASGSGRRRLASELADRLRGEGRRVIELGPAVDPLRSLGPLAPGPSELAGADLERALAKATMRVQDALAQGATILAVTSDLDAWSRRVLDDVTRILTNASPAAPGGLVLGLDPAEGARPEGLTVTLEPLSEGDLRTLFQGPDRVFHLQQDGARELWRRTEGHPARVVAEVAAWVRAGLARWSGQRLAIDRQALGRLAMGLNVAPPERSSDLAGPSLAAGLEEHLAWVVLAGGEVERNLLATARGLPTWRLEAEEAELVAAGALRRFDTPDGQVVRALVHPAQLDEWSDVERREAHGRLADLLEPGTPGRLLHVVSAGRLQDVPAEALVVAHGHLDRGELAQAEAALVEGLIAVRSGDPTAPGGERRAELPLLEAWLAVALADFKPQALDRVLYEAARAGAEQLERFAKAALLTLEHPGERALALLETVSILDDPELERWRHALLLQAARGAPPEREAELLEACASWCREHDRPANRASLAEWTGRLLYRQDRHLEAAEQFERAAAGRVRVTPRLSAWLNAASALLEAGDFPHATELARAARELAAGCRHELFEVRAEWILRASAYRRGSAKEPDLELVEAAGRVGVPDQEALIALTEAAVAWRERHTAAAELACRAMELWSGLGKTWATVLASSLALAAAGPGGLEGRTAELAELGERALACPDPAIGGQALALLVRSGMQRPAGCAELAVTLAEAYPEESRDARREVLSIGEVIGALEPRSS